MKSKHTSLKKYKNWAKLSHVTQDLEFTSWPRSCGPVLQQLGGVHRLHWQYFCLFWPPTMLTFVKEFLCCYKDKSAYWWYFQYHIPTSFCQRSLWTCRKNTTALILFSCLSLPVNASRILDIFCQHTAAIAQRSLAVLLHSCFGHMSVNIRWKF